jgi:hypothetical protein
MLDRKRRRSLRYFAPSVAWSSPGSWLWATSPVRLCLKTPSAPSGPPPQHSAFGLARGGDDSALGLATDWVVLSLSTVRWPLSARFLDDLFDLGPVG